MAKLFEDIRAMHESGEVEKFNPYHDTRGRFSTGPNAASFTTRTKDPKKQHWADKARDRESVRVGVLGTGKRMVGTSVGDKKSRHNVHEPKSSGGKLIGNAERQRTKLKRMDEKGEKYESSRERKSRLAREKRATKKKNLPKGGAKIYQMPKGNKRPPRKTA